MKLFSINSVPYGSTGNIMYSISEFVRADGEAIYVTGYSFHKEKKDVFIGGFISKVTHMILSRITGLNGCFSILPTVFLINKIKKFNPNVIHLHNLHGWYVNLPLLFSFLKKQKIRIVWTLHDCWAITGQCPNFTMVRCNKWKTGCSHCPQYNMTYPKTLVDITKKMWKLKKKWFTNVQNMTIVTPSQWLLDIVKQSYLKDYPIKVINNGIDLSVFKPTYSNFLEKNRITDKYVILGVSLDWGIRKGLDIFIELSTLMDDRYQVILVGTNETIDKELTSNIISIHRTNNQHELAEIYSAADVFVNPTREDNFPTVNIESIACGTPVITFDTGGSPEIIDKKTGIILKNEDINILVNEIIRICETKPFSKEDLCLRAKSFDQKERFNEYIDLFKK